MAHPHDSIPAASHADHAHQGHSHGPAVALTNVSRLLVIGAAMNLLYVIVEAGAGVYYHSLALVADAGHNLSDVAGLLISLLAFWLARRRPTEAFTYGLRKSTVLASLLNAALLLITIGGILWESIHRFRDPQPVPGSIVAWVALLGIVVNTGSALLFRGGTELNVRGAYLHLLADALVSVGVAAAGLGMRYTGWYWLDPVVGLVVCVVIAGSSWRLLADSVRLSLDGVPSPIALADVEAKIRQVPGVQEVHHIHIWSLSTTETALTAHLMLDTSLDAAAVAALKRTVRHELEHLQIQHATLEIETGPGTCQHASCT
jgi:cobalt-zinc-cadmium efflux system protein